MICINCNKECVEGVSFCYHCGMNFQEASRTTKGTAIPSMFCQSCGKRYEGSGMFCTHCGRNSSEIPDSIVSTASNTRHDRWEKNNYVTQQNTLKRRNKSVPGKMLLMISGILYIIIGCIAIITGVLALAHVVEMQSAMAEMYDFGFIEAPAIPYMSMFVNLVVYILAVVAGIFGVKNAEKPERAQLCFKVGILMIATQFTNIVVQYSTYGLVYFNTGIFDVFILALPVLFLLGSHKNKQVYR